MASALDNAAYNARWRAWEMLYGGAAPYWIIDPVDRTPDPDPWAHLSGAERMARRRWVGQDAWERNAPDDHPGWGLLMVGMERVTRIHGVAGHRCQLCDEVWAQVSDRAATGRSAGGPGDGPVVKNADQQESG